MGERWSFNFLHEVAGVPYDSLKGRYFHFVYGQSFRCLRVGRIPVF